MTRRELLVGAAAFAIAPQRARTPIIFDTDIGDDIDDTWALGLLMRSPSLDVRLVLTEFGKPEVRAKLATKLLSNMGYGRVPVGLGVEAPAASTNPQAEWVGDWTLDRYRGRIHRNGVDEMIRIAMSSRTPVTIIAVGPVTNLAEALRREPRIAERARIVGMQGSVRKGYGLGPKPDAEYNVERDIRAAQSVFSAAWPITITPLDTCGNVNLHSERYRRFASSSDPVAVAIRENFEVWDAAQKGKKRGEQPAPTQSSVLFDTLAVYLAAEDRSLLKIEKLGLRVDERGYTVEDAAAKRIEVATEWADRGAQDRFHDLLVQRVAR